MPLLLDIEYSYRSEVIYIVIHIIRADALNKTV